MHNISEEVFFQNVVIFNCLMMEKVLQNFSDMSVVIPLSRPYMVQLRQVLLNSDLWYEKISMSAMHLSVLC
jgi:hypothetical protein